MVRVDGTSRSSNAATGALKSRGFGHAVGTNRATARHLEFLAVVFADKATARAVQNLYPIHKPARDDGDFLGFSVDDPKLCAKAQPPFLRHDQEFAIGGVEIGVPS